MDQELIARIAKTGISSSHLNRKSMKAKNTLWHITWGDGDDSFVIAPDENSAKKRLSEGKDMITCIVRLDNLYQWIFKAGMKEVAEFVDSKSYISRREWQAMLEEWGL